jgi:hypothetical protein
MVRLHCCVPFCQRTTPKGLYDEWICQRHWSPVRQQHRRAYNRIRRLLRQSDGTDDTLCIRAARLWSRVRQEAINLAVGI